MKEGQSKALIDSDRLNKNWGCLILGMGILGIVIFGGIGLAGSASGGAWGATLGLVGLVLALSSLGMIIAVALPMMGVQVPRVAGLVFAAVMVLVLAMVCHAQSTITQPPLMGTVQVTIAGDVVTVNVSNVRWQGVTWIWMDDKVQNQGVMADASGAATGSYKVAPGKHVLMACDTKDYTDSSFTKPAGECSAPVSFTAP